MMSERVEFFVPMKPPRSTHQMKQVRIVKGKPCFYEPPSLAAARAKLSAHLAKHRPPHRFGGALRVVVKWLFPTKKKAAHGQYKITRPDTHNLNKLLFDVMTDLKFWEDDAQVCSEIIEKIWTCEIPGIWISISPLASPEP
jgi:Holliday junction resolvase RusA-like endonuclease